MSTWPAFQVLIDGDQVRSECLGSANTILGIPTPPLYGSSALLPVLPLHLCAYGARRAG